MNTDTWNEINAAGNRWEALNMQLVDAQFRVMELERETTTAYAEFQQALASVQTPAPAGQTDREASRWEAL